MGKWLLSSLKHPDRLWGPTTPSSMVTCFLYQDVKLTSHFHLASMLRMCACLRLTPLFSFMVWTREHWILLVNPSSCSKDDILNVARWVQRCTASHSIKSLLLIVERISTVAELTMSYSLNVITFAGFRLSPSGTACVVMLSYLSHDSYVPDESSFKKVTERVDSVQRKFKKKIWYRTQFKE
jgi:hypothetical protein